MKCFTEKVKLVETGHVGKSRKENISLANKKGGGMLWAKGQKLKHLWGLVWETERRRLYQNGESRKDNVAKGCGGQTVGDLD